MSTLIRNGRIIRATDTCLADIYIEGETIKEIGNDLEVTPEKTIDASGKLIFPGGIDPHVHLELPVMGTISSDDYESGSRAALYGGTTTIIDFANQNRGDSLNHALSIWMERAAGQSFCDYSFHISITDFTDEVRKELREIVRSEGISSFKTFMAYPGTMMIDDAQILAIMNEVKKNKGVVMVHATDGKMIEELVSKFRTQNKLSTEYHYLSQPEVTETVAVKRFIDMAAQTGVRAYIVHMSSEGAANLVKQAAQLYPNLIGETCPQYLLLDASLYKNEDAPKWVMSPPLREEKDRNALWKGIEEGLIKTVGTDHCPFMLADKIKNRDDFTKIPNGAPGLEHRTELLYSEGVRKGRLSLNKLVEVSSTNAAKIFGLYPKKGAIAVGSDADLVIFDPNAKHTISAKTHHQHCDYSAYEGLKVTGITKTVLLRGQLVIDEGQLMVGKGYGQFVKRGVSS